jgi:peptidoglycan hydrolase-like protein with peptidoglycan-binding domain
MSGTVAYHEMTDLAREWEKIYRSAVCSGVVGNARHARRGGYHIGRGFQSPRNYSVIRPDDRSGPNDGSSGIDMTMNKRDMVLCTKRLAAAYYYANDPRRKYINAINGWDGSGSATRFDFYARRTGPASSDHKWHVHLEKRRRFIRDRVANRAILSLLRGETVAQWLQSCGIKTARAATAKAPPYPGRVLQRNDRMRPDRALRKWQERMRERGWTSIGKADGVFGGKTERVVKGWQRTVKITVDGKVGPKTWPTPWTRPMGR